MPYSRGQSYWTDPINPAEIGTDPQAPPAIIESDSPINGTITERYPGSPERWEFLGSWPNFPAVFARVFYDAASPYDCRIGLLWQDAGGQWHYADVYSQGSLNGHSHFPLALRRFEAHSQVWLVVAGGFSGPSYGYTYVYNYRVDAAGASPTLTAFSGGGQPEINYEQVEILRAPEPDRFFVAYASTSTAVNVSLRGINSSGSVSSLALGSVTPYGYAGLGNGSHTINRWYITEWDTANSRYLLISRGTHPSSPTKNYLVAQVITVSGGGYTVTTGAGALLLPSGTLSTGPRDLNARALWVQKLAANLAAIGYYNAEAGHQVTLVNVNPPDCSVGGAVSISDGNYPGHGADVVDQDFTDQEAATYYAAATWRDSSANLALGLLRLPASAGGYATGYRRSVTGLGDAGTAVRMLLPITPNRVALLSQQTYPTAQPPLVSVYEWTLPEVFCGSYCESLPEGSSYEHWRLAVFDSEGVLRFHRDASHPIQAVESFSVAAWGDCLEATLTGLGPGLGLEERDVVEVQVSVDGENWCAWYSGTVVQNAAPDDPNPSRIKLAGLRKVLQGQPVTQAGFPRQDLAITARLAVSHNLPKSCRYYNGNFPYTGFIAGELVPNYQSVDAVLEALAGQVPGLYHGVNAAREPFLKAPSGVHTVAEGAEGVTVEWLEVNAEDVVTVVDLVLGFADSKGRKAGEKFTGRQPVVQRAEADAVIEGTVKRLLIPYSSALFEPRIPLGIAVTTPTGFMLGDEENLLDLNPTTGATFVGGFGSGSGVFTRLNQICLEVPPGVDIDGFYFGTDAAVELAYSVRYAAPGSPPVYPPEEDIETGPGYVLAPMAAHPTQAVQVAITFRSVSPTIFVHSLYPIYRKPWLHDVAAGYLKPPFQNPARVTLPGLWRPRPNVRIQRLAGGEIVRRAERYEYQITRERYQVTTIYLEQGYPAEKAAVADLRALREQRTLEQALNFFRGGE